MQVKILTNPRAQVIDTQVNGAEFAKDLSSVRYQMLEADQMQQDLTHFEKLRKVEFFTPQQAAKRSLEDHADLVTETLARIYEQQGNLAKAAQAYRKLALRTPERSAEFIARAMALEGRQDR